MSRTRLAATTLRPLALGLAGLALFAGCGSSTGSNSSSTSTNPTKRSAEATPNPGEDMRAKRYCEVLLLHPEATGLTADVYNSFPMNSCPQAQWEALDATAIAAANSVPIAVLNGPRYWLMDRAAQTPREEVHVDFGGIDMVQRATVAIEDFATASKPYYANHVNRKAVFAFDKGQTVYELTGPDGAKYVMQSWSQQVDPTLVESGLAGLESRLQLPAGWSYGPRILTRQLKVVTTKEAAVVVQDELRNSYSRETGTEQP